MTALPDGENRIPAGLPPDDEGERARLRLAGVVHDVNQMLAVILGRTELLLHREKTGTRRQDLEAIALAAGDAAAMLKRLRRGVPTPLGDRGQAGANLGAVVRDVALMIRPGGTGEWADPQEDPDGKVWVLGQDVPAELTTSVPGQVLREVLSNLVVNGLEVLPDGGRIDVTAAVDGDKVVLAVSDNGPGLDVQTARRIFEPGFTSSGSLDRGIGLAGSRQLLKCFGAGLTLDPGPREGAQFLLDLPRVDPPPPKAEAKPGEGADEGTPPVSFPVLIVDDDAGVRDMLCDVLTELDCRATACGDARTALDGFEPGRFGLALVDQSLPGRSGLDLAAELRERDPLLVVALVTGWGQEEVLAAVDPAIVDLTATKPLEWTRIIDLLTRSENLHRRRREAGPRR